MFYKIHFEHTNNPSNEWKTDITDMDSKDKMKRKTNTWEHTNSKILQKLCSTVSVSMEISLKGESNTFYSYKIDSFKYPNNWLLNRIKFESMKIWFEAILRNFNVSNVIHFNDLLNLELTISTKIISAHQRCVKYDSQFSLFVWFIWVWDNIGSFPPMDNFDFVSMKGFYRSNEYFPFLDAHKLSRQPFII